MREQCIDLTTRHKAYELVIFRLIYPERIDTPTIAQYRNPVPDQRNFLHPMCDVYDPDAFAPESVNQLEKAIGFLFCECSSRLIQDQDLWLRVQRFSDLNQLLVSP